MHFHNVRVEAIPFPQSEVHGLLGRGRWGLSPQSRRPTSWPHETAPSSQPSSSQPTEAQQSGPLLRRTALRPPSKARVPLRAPTLHTTSSTFRCMARERSRTRASSARRRQLSRVIEKYLTL